MQTITTTKSNESANKLVMIAQKDVATEKSYWNTFYTKFTLAVPSQFCVLTAVEVNKVTSSIVEFGCGNGRDSIYLANQGFHVFATDLSAETIRKNQKVSLYSGKRLEFISVDATNIDQVKDVIGKARASSCGRKNVV